MQYGYDSKKHNKMDWYNNAVGAGTVNSNISIRNNTKRV